MQGLLVRHPFFFVFCFPVVPFTSNEGDDANISSTLSSPPLFLVHPFLFNFHL